MNINSINILISIIFILLIILILYLYFKNKDRTILPVYIKYILNQIEDDSRKKQFIKSCGYALKMSKTEIKSLLDNLNDYEISAREFFSSTKMVLMLILLLVSNVLYLLDTCQIISIKLPIVVMGTEINIVQKINCKLLLIAGTFLFSGFIVIKFKLMSKNILSSIKAHFTKKEKNQ